MDLPKNTSEELRRSSLRYLWMHNRDWTSMGEEGDPLIVVEGEGIRVKDIDGNSWIDVNGGYNSVNAGYGRREIADAVHKQLTKLPYFPNGTTTEPTIELAQKLTQMSPGNLSRVFPVSGGSEANETAIKIVRAYHRRRGDKGRYKIISRRGSYHGTTGGVLWLGGHVLNPRADYEPEYPGMLYAPHPNSYRCEFGEMSDLECAIKCAQAVEDVILQNGPETIAAFIGEPIAVPAGAVVPGDPYWPMIRDICDKYGVVLVMDEVICGFGRTGKMFASEHWDVVPDIMTVAKGITSSYFPLAATLVSEDIADQFGGANNYLRHVFTSSGHPVASAAALKNIEIIQRENLVENARSVGDYLKGQLLELMETCSVIGDVRGKGLLLAVELVSDRKEKATFPPEFELAKRLNHKFSREGLIFRVGGPILTIGPPLCITTSEVDEIVVILKQSFLEIAEEFGMAGII